ncbi:MAG: hypothetical protein Q9157_003932 [Trypethelium eluteriae]
MLGSTGQGPDRRVTLDGQVDGGVSDRDLPVGVKGEAHVPGRGQGQPATRMQAVFSWGTPLPTVNFPIAASREPSGGVQQKPQSDSSGASHPKRSPPPPVATILIVLRLSFANFVAETIGISNALA